MKKSKIEKHLFDEADTLISGVPSFESIDKRVDWDGIASKTGRQKRIHWEAIAATACACSLIVGVALGLTIHYNKKPPTNYGQDEKRPIVLGNFSANKWNCLNEQWDFSESSIVVQNKKLVNSIGNVNLYNRGIFRCSISFHGGPFANFNFTDFSSELAGFGGNAFYENTVYPIGITFGLVSETPKNLEIVYGNSSTASVGNVYYHFTK